MSAVALQLALLLLCKVSHLVTVGSWSYSVSHSLNSLKGLYRDYFIGDYFGGYKGDARSLDYVYIKPISQNSTYYGRLLAAASTVPATSHPFSGGGGNCCLFFKDLFCYTFILCCLTA